MSYLPKGVKPSVLRYWFPPDGKGVVDNDLMVMLKGGKNPVLAHLFLNHMLETKNARWATSATSATSRRRTRSTSTKSSRDGYLPANLASAVVEREYFTEGYRAARAAAGGRRRVARGLAAVQGRGLTATLADGRTAGDASGGTSDPSMDAACARGPAHWLWVLFALPGIIWLLLLFLVPLYVVFADRVRPGRPDLPHAARRSGTRSQWNTVAFTDVFKHIVGADGYFGPALLRTADLRPRREHAVPADRLPGGLLHGPATPGGTQAGCSPR